MELKFIDGSDISGLSKNSEYFIQYAAGDPAKLLDSFTSEVFKIQEHEDSDSQLSMKRPLADYLTTDLRIELVASFTPVDTSFEFDKSVRFFRLDKYDRHVFEKPFTLFFDKSGRVYTLNRCLSIKEKDRLYGLCVDVLCFKTDSYTLNLYLIKDPDGVVIF